MSISLQPRYLVTSTRTHFQDIFQGRVLEDKDKDIQSQGHRQRKKQQVLTFAPHNAIVKIINPGSNNNIL